MSHSSLNPGRGLSQQWLRWQAVIAGLVALLGFILIGSWAGLSAGLGGLVSVIANAYFARRLFRHAGASSAQQIVASFYAGEALKLLISLVGLGLLFYWGIFNPFALFFGFVLTYLGGFALIILSSVKNVKNTNNEQMHG